MSDAFALFVMVIGFLGASLLARGLERLLRGSEDE